MVIEQIKCQWCNEVVGEVHDDKMKLWVTLHKCEGMYMAREGLKYRVEFHLTTQGKRIPDTASESYDEALMKGLKSGWLEWGIEKVWVAE